MKVAVRAGVLIDGTGRSPVPRQVILIEDDRVTEIVPDIEGAVPPDYTLFDATGYTVLPGLIDAHLHISGSGDPGERPPTGPVAQSIPNFTLNCYRNALKDLEAGFTTVRDAGCRYYADIAVRDQINSGLLEGPRIWACGQGITSTTGHMDREKMLPPHQSNSDYLTTVADGPTEARRAVRINLRFDVDHIKINATLTEHVRRYGGYCSPEMTKETLEAICDEAHMHGRRVCAHCYGGPGADWALQAGLDGIEHGFYLSDAQLGFMAEHGVVLCPTMSVTGRMRQNFEAGILTGNPGQDEWRRKAVANNWNTVRRAHAAGVKIIVGTDCGWTGNIHGTNAFELEMLVEAGLSSMEAIIAATGGAAAGIGFAEVGTLKPGNYADMILVDGDPLNDVRILQSHSKIPVVIKGGKPVVDRR